MLNGKFRNPLSIVYEQRIPHYDERDRALGNRCSELAGTVERDKFAVKIVSVTFSSLTMALARSAN